MSSRERSSKSSSLNGIRDIGTFVENYDSLLDKLFPVFAVWDVVVYVTRWENYLLTLSVILAFSFLFYFPAILFSLLTLSAILVMGIGRYHGQTKAIIALRQPPAVELLDSDQQVLKKLHSEQKHMHKSRIEFRQILSNAESFIVSSRKWMDYIYSVYLWKSPEVSLCVTVLLCVLLLLLCTVSLHSIGATLPVIVLCTNKYFFSRTVDLWKQLLTRLNQWWKKRKTRQQVSESSKNQQQPQQQQSQHSCGGQVRDGEEEREAATADPDTVEPGMARASEEQQCNNETAAVCVEATGPQLRRRAPDRTALLQSQASAEQTSLAGGGGEAVMKSGESVAAEVEGSYVGLPSSGGVGTPQLTRKDGKSSQPDLCSSCQTSFAKLLKRKHDCNFCGQTFCGSCTAKVKRAALGATSPAAFEESVRVCLNCKTKLDSYACSKE